MGIRNRNTVEDLDKAQTEQPELFEEILALAIDGEHALDHTLPILFDRGWTFAGFIEWVNKDEARAKRWADAKAQRAELRRERVTHRMYLRAVTDGIAVSESGLLTAAKMIIGDRVEHSGKDGGALIVKIEQSDANL